MRERKPTAEKHKREVDVPRGSGTRERCARDVPTRERRSDARVAHRSYLCTFVPLYLCTLHLDITFVIY